MKLFSLTSTPSLLEFTYPVNPLQPNISMQTLYTIVYTFPKVLTRRICLTIKSFLSLSFPLLS